MDTYFVDYDLRKKGEHDYQNLFAALELLGAIRILESLWSLKRNGTSCRMLFDHFKQFMHGDDGLSVSQVTDWAMNETLACPDDQSPKTTK